MTIHADQFVEIDVDTAILDKLEINGWVQFSNTTSATLKARQVFVRKGKLVSGSAANPTDSGIKHTVELHGERGDNTLYFDPNIEPGNKVLAVTGMLEMYGAPKTPWVKLTRSANAGDTQLYLEKVEGWAAGDKIVVAPSSFNKDEFEERTITRFDRKDNIVWFTEPLKYFHAGELIPPVNGHNIDVRAAVGNLSRNVRIVGADFRKSGHNGNLLVTDFLDTSASITQAPTRNG